MARLVDGTTSNQIRFGTFAPVVKCVSVWLRPASTSHNAAHVWAGDNPFAAADWDWSLFTFAGTLFAQSKLDVFTSIDSHIVEDAWQHIFIVRDNGAGDGEYYVNGGLVVTETGGASSSIGILRIGGSGTGTPDSGLSELSTWSDLLPLTEIRSLAHGEKPNKIRPNTQTAYYDLSPRLQGIEIDLLGRGNHGTVTGTKQALNPPQIKPEIVGTIRKPWYPLFDDVTRASIIGGGVGFAGNIIG